MENVLGTRRSDTDLNAVVDRSDFETLAENVGTAAAGWNSVTLTGTGVLASVILCSGP